MAKLIFIPFICILVAITVKAIQIISNDPWMIDPYYWIVCSVAGFVLLFELYKKNYKKI